MKKLFTLLALSVSFAATAQSWYIKPTMGIGQTKPTGRIPSFYEQSIFFKGEIAAGREIGKIRIETGLGFFNPSYGHKGMTFDDDFDLKTGQWKAHTDFDYNLTYAYLPVRVAYKIDVLTGLSIVPAAGISALYNVHAERIVTTTRATPLVLSDLKSQANKITAMADFLLLAEYKIGVISVTAGASYKRMVTSIYKNSSDRFHFLSGDAGILYHF